MTLPVDHLTGRPPPHGDLAFSPPREIADGELLKQLVVRLLGERILPAQVLLVGVPDELMPLDQDVQLGLTSR